MIVGRCAPKPLCHNRLIMSLTDRRHARAEVSFEATLGVGGKSGECRIVNISAGGAQVTSRMPVSRGDDVVLNIGVMGKVSGKVAWVGRNGIGIKFANDIDTMGDLLMAFAIY